MGWHCSSVHVWAVGFGDVCLRVQECTLSRYFQVATIQSDLGAEKTNWEALLEQLQTDGVQVCAHAMNPKLSGALQTRERLYHVWYQHANAKKHDPNLVIPDGDVSQAVLDCTALMQHLNENMSLGLEMGHFLLPNGDLQVGKEAMRLSNELEKKVKQKEKQAEKPGPRKRKGSAAGGQDDDDEEDVGQDKVPKWHAVHKAVWEELLAGVSMPAGAQWSPAAIQLTPHRYKANEFYDSLCARSKDLLRMIDIAVPLSSLHSEMVIDLSELHVYC